MISQRIRMFQAQSVMLIGQSPLVQRGCHIRVVSLKPERHAQRISELPAARIAISGNLRQRSQKNVIHGRRQIGPPRCQQWRRRRQLRVQHCHALIPGKRRLPRQQREHRARQRVLIRARIYLLPLDLLGCTVIERPHDQTCSCQAGRRHPAFGQPEIREVHVIGPTGPRVHQHVGRLDITVHQPGSMGSVQGRGHRGDNRGRARSRQRAQPTHQRPCIAAGHISHGDEQHTVRISGFEHRDDVRIVHGRRGPGLTDEAVPECLIRRQARRENLERYLPVEPLILGSEYNRHSAAANLLLQSVSGDLRTGRETDQEPYGSGSLIAHHASRTRKPSSSLLYRRAQRERRVRTDIPGQKE